MTAVDHAELKRLAEGAGGDEWGFNDWRPEGQILVCGGEGHSYGLFATVDDALPDVAAFIAAANPAVVLELLSEIEGLKASASVIEPELGDLEASNKDLSRLLSEAERELAVLRTQAPDSWRPDRDAVKSALGCIRPKMVTGWRGESVMGLGMEGLDQAADAILALKTPATKGDFSPQQ